MIICNMGRERKLLVGHLKDEVCIAYRSYYKRTFLVWKECFPILFRSKKHKSGSSIIINNIAYPWSGSLP